MKRVLFFISVLLVACQDVGSLQGQSSPLWISPQSCALRTPSASDPDTDADGFVDSCDTCPSVANPNQLDSNYDGIGDACTDDADGDGIPDTHDTCPKVFQKPQSHTSPLKTLDSDHDGLGDSCDPCPRGEDTLDSDGDGINDCQDLCPHLSSPINTDRDGDGVGDPCDNCIDLPNAGQIDRDANGIGDACESAPFSLIETDIHSLHQAIKGGHISCETIIRGSLHRIATYDLSIRKDRPPINAFVGFNRAAIEQARRLDESFHVTGQLVGPLHCVPIAVKDLYASVGTPVTAGSRAFHGLTSAKDGFAVGRLKKAGAIVLGTTSMDEMSYGIFGISGKHGKSGNPYNTFTNSGGSSSGSAAATASSFVVAALGTDNCASLTIPGAYNGLVSLRSTVGLISMSGVFPSNYVDEVPGPLTRTVTDLAQLLDVMATQDPDDPRTMDYPTERPRYVDHLKPHALKGARIGVLRHLGLGDESDYPFDGGSPEVAKVFRQALRDLERAGAIVFDNVTVNDFDLSRFGIGLWTTLPAFLANYTTGGPRSFPEACRTGQFSHFVHADSSQCLDYWDHQQVGEVGSKRHHAVDKRYAENGERIKRVLDRLHLDALVYPVDALGTAHDFAAMANCLAASASKTPQITVPAGHVNGLPVGILFHGPKWSEARLIELAFSYETATKHRRPPLLSPPEKPNEIPSFSYDRETLLRNLLSERVFSGILKNGNKTDMTALKMRDVVRQAATEKHLPYLLK